MKTSDLRAAYKTAVEDGRTQFSIEDATGKHELITGYAFYLLEYLDMMKQAEFEFQPAMEARGAKA